MNKLFTSIAAVSLGLTMAVGVGTAVGTSVSKEAVEAKAASIPSTYTLLTTSNLNTLTTSDKVVIVATISGNATGVTGYSGSDATVSTTTSDWLEFSVTSVDTTNKTYSLKDNSANKWITLNASNKFTITSSSATNLNAHASGYFNYTDSNSGSRYLAKNGTYYRCYKGNTQSSYTYFYVYKAPAATIAATINGSNSVNVGTQWAPTSITEDVSGNTVSGATYAFAASGGAVISSSNTTTGAFTCSAAGTVTVSATKSGFEIASKTVTVNSSDPYINLTLTSGADAYTGQTVSITSEYGNGVTGLTWTVQSGTVSDVTSSNSGYSAKIGGSTGTLKIRATDTGSALYEEVSVSVTKVTLTLSKNSTTIRQGKSETLTATHNASSVGGVNWTSDNAKVTVGATTGVVTVASDAAVDSTATITATSAVDSSVSATCVVTVAEQPLVYEIAFGSTKNTNPTELTTSTFLSVFSVDSNVSCSAISKMYAKDNTNQLKIGSSKASASITLSIPSNQYFVSVEAVIATGANLNLQVQSGASGSTLEAQNVTSADTYTFDDYLSSEESNIVTISTSTSGAIYLTELNLYYAVKTPTITVDIASHSIRTNETAVSTVTIANFASTPTLEYNIQSGSSSISTVVIGAISNNQATVTITPSSTAGTAVVRIRDHANPSSYYVDITVVVSEVPSYYMVLDAYTDTGTDYGYKGGVIEIDVTDSHLAGDIEWEVTSGSVSGASSDNDGFIATISSVGTLTIVATDDGDNTNTETVTITVVDSLNPVMADITTKHESSLVFTEAYGDGPATTDDSKTWTVTSDGTESTFDSVKGIHYGTGSAAVQYIKANSSSYSSLKITKVVVNASAASSVSATVGVKVGSKQFGGDPQSIGTTAEEYTFTGNETASSIEVEVTKPSSANKALYLKSIVVTYETSSGEVDISNKAGMHKAQQAVIDYANDFLDTLDDICVSYGSTDPDALSEAWGNLATQYDNWFNKGAKDLSTDEIDQAKNLLAYASDNKTGDVLQRMVDQYDWIVSHYGTLDNFLHDDAGRDSLYDSTGRVAILADVNSSNIIPIIVIVSLISVSAIGGYFYIRRRKEHN